MMIRNGRLIALAFASALSLMAEAAVKRVPAQFATIQAAVDAASNGDVVRVAAGTYVENVSIEHKRVSLIADEGPERTTIDAGHRGRSLTIVEAGEGWLTVTGFSLINGHNTFLGNDAVSSGVGGAIYAVDSNVRIIGNVMRSNGSCLGMAVSTVAGNILLNRNRIEKNTAIPDCSVAAVVLRPSVNSEAEVTENIISDHFAIGLWIQGDGKATVANNIIRNNDGRSPWYMAEVGGLYAGGARLVVRNNLFSGNAGTAYGGAYVGAAQDPSATVLIQNNSFTNNAGPIAAGLIVSGFTETSHKVTKNQFDDSGTLPSVNCLFPIDNDNVFASPLETALQGCSMKP